VSCALEVDNRHKWDAVVLSGSSLNMSESLETSKISKDLMTLLQMQDVAVLGVCFGMQLLAVVMKCHFIDFHLLFVLVLL
jgi:GMP synthase-like glutamine amidotransferase